MINYNIDNGIAILTWNMEGYPMNVLNEKSIKLFDELLDKAHADSSVKGIIIASEKDSFIAGADLKMMKKMLARDIKTMDAKETFENSYQLNAVLRKYEVGGKPVVAAINGHALGGGYEICLASHYRIAINNPKTKIGLPEAKIGLFPGAGGTQRLPRLIGIQGSAELLLEGKEVDPQTALKKGMINELVNTREEMMAAARKWIDANPVAMQPWDEKDKKGVIVGKTNYKIPGGNVQSPQAAQILMPGTALLMTKSYGNYPAQLAIMNCLYEGLQVSIEKGLRIESKYFTGILMNPVAKNMIRTLFFSIGEANKGIARPKDVTTPVVKKVGILGAGLMGSGIAYVSALAGLQVVLKDVTMEAALKANGLFGKYYSEKLLLDRVSKGKMTKEQMQETLDRIHPTDKAEDLQGCDYIIEAVFENRELKAKVTVEAEAQLGEAGVFGTNTSTLPITGLSTASKRPENFIGIHFFSPVDKMPLVEVIMGEKTSDYALAMTIDYILKIKKTPIVVNDSRGFYTSRCFGTYTSEGAEMLAEGINPMLIENGGKMAGMPVGPLDVADAVALDLAYKVMKQTELDTGMKIEDMPSGKVIKKMVEELGRTGKKDKKGFYEYPENAKKQIWSGLKGIYPLAATQPSIDDIKKRLLHRQAIEAVRCLEEGVLRSVEDADVGSIMAWGFPPYTGGVLSYIEMIGVDTFVKDCDQLADQFGERFRPSDRLRQMAAQKELFYKVEKMEEELVA